MRFIHALSASGCKPSAFDRSSLMRAPARGPRGLGSVRQSSWDVVDTVICQPPFCQCCYNGLPVILFGDDPSELCALLGVNVRASHVV